MPKVTQPLSRRALYEPSQPDSRSSTPNWVPPLSPPTTTALMPVPPPKCLVCPPPPDCELRRGRDSLKLSVQSGTEVLITVWVKKGTNGSSAAPPHPGCLIRQSGSPMGLSPSVTSSLTSSTLPPSTFSWTNHPQYCPHVFLQPRD